MVSENPNTANIVELQNYRDKAQTKLKLRQKPKESANVLYFTPEFEGLKFDSPLITATDKNITTRPEDPILLGTVFGEQIKKQLAL